jgi:hypothetical protein
MKITERLTKFGKIVRLDESKEYTRCRHDVSVTFNVINTRKTHPSSDVYDGMGVANTEIFDICHDIVETIFTIYEWSNHAIDESFEMIEKYLFTDFAKSNEMRGRHVNWDTTAVFFVISKESNFNWKHIGVSASYGYMTADQFLDFSDNFAMVRTSFDNYKKMNEKYIVREQGRTRYELEDERSE